MQSYQACHSFDELSVQVSVLAARNRPLACQSTSVANRKIGRKDGNTE